MLAFVFVAALPQMDPFPAILSFPSAGPARGSNASRALCWRSYSWLHCHKWTRSQPSFHSLRLALPGEVMHLEPYVGVRIRGCTATNGPVPSHPFIPFGWPCQGK